MSYKCYFYGILSTDEEFTHVAEFKQWKEKTKSTIDYLEGSFSIGEVPAAEIMRLMKANFPYVQFYWIYGFPCDIIENLKAFIEEFLIPLGYHMTDQEMQWMGEEVGDLGVFRVRDNVVEVTEFSEP